MSNFRTIQLTNRDIGVVNVGSNMPLGIITRKVCCGNQGTRTFDVSTSGADTITLNEQGYYDIAYNASLIATATGVLNISLVTNGITIYMISETATAGDTINITLPYQLRVFNNCATCSTNNPMNIQFSLSGVAVTDGESNVIVEKVY